MNLKIFFRVLMIGVLMLLSTVPALAQNQSDPRGNNGDKTIRVMSRNLYFGADLTPVISAQTPEQFVLAVSNAYNAAVATNFPERAAAVAAEIATTQPALVGLQEVALWRTGPVLDPTPATTVQFDFLALLLDALAAQGERYEVVAIVAGFDAESPTILGFDVRLTIHDVLLARDKVKRGDLKLSNLQTANFTTNLTFPTAVGPITFLRQWAAVDVKLRGREFRLITTHLEAFAAPVRVAQAQELLAGPANTTLPTIIIGDLNSQPGAAGDAAATLITSGFTDAWSVVNPGVPGFTCCQAADLRNPASLLSERIDLVLTRGDLPSVDGQVTGADVSNKTPSGLWPSDHAGVVVTLRLPE